jgi:hypothetical protein
MQNRGSLEVRKYICHVGFQGAVADADADGDVDAVAEAPDKDEPASSSFAVSEDDKDVNCPRISPFVCCLV